jgi:diguanylate cyclase (GGDEF)-like protein
MVIEQVMRYPIGVFVDDEPLLLAALRRVFEDAPLEFVGFSSATEALHWLADHTADAVVTDYRMAPIDGSHFLSALPDSARSVRRMLLSGQTDLEALSNAVNSGAVSRFVTKPWNADLLRMLVLREAALARLDRMGLELVPLLRGWLSREGVTAARDQLAQFVSDLGYHTQWFEGPRVVELPSTAVGDEVRTVVLIPEEDRENLFPPDELLERSEALAVAAAQACLLAVRREDAYHALEVRAETDPLSGLKNRRVLDHVLEVEVQHSSRYGNPLVAVLFDIDHFKQINDQHGHAAGDMVIREIGEILLSAIRESDVAARIGGDEFALILRESEPSKATLLCDRIRTAVDSRGFPFPVTLSFGIAAWTSETKEGTTMLGAADEALYQAKELGRNRVVIHQ